MPKPKFTIPLKATETIRTVYAERVKGSGYTNNPIFAIIYDAATGRYREECIQPRDFNETLMAIFGVCVSAHEALMSAVGAYVVKEKLQ